MNDTLFLDSREAITGVIRQLISEQPEDSPILIVVAFLGQGIDRLLQPRKAYKLVCNLSLGGTNPAALEQLMDCVDSRLEIKHLPTLHAKVVMASTGAVVSSANFSASGLDLGDGADGWLEAGVFLPRTAPAFSGINRWAWDRWMAAADVTPDVLREVYRNYRRTGQGEIASPAGVQDSTQAVLSPPGDFGLTENILFRPLSKQNPNNVLRAGSDQMNRLYGKFLGRELSRRDSWIVAYVANLLWTHAGCSMDWREGEFRKPHQVVQRWREKKVKDDLIHQFLIWLSTAESAPDSVRTASRHLCSKSWKDYAGGNAHHRH